MYIYKSRVKRDEIESIMICDSILFLLNWCALYLLVKVGEIKHKTCRITFGCHNHAWQIIFIWYCPCTRFQSLTIIWTYKQKKTRCTTLLLSIYRCTLCCTSILIYLVTLEVVQSLKNHQGGKSLFLLLHVRWFFSTNCLKIRKLWKCFWHKFAL